MTDVKVGAQRQSRPVQGVEVEQTQRISRNDA